MKSPLDLRAALQMMALLAAVGLVAALLRAEFGDAGLYIVAAISGLVDLDAITITAARLTVTPATAATAILIATAVNLTVKAMLAATLGTPAIARAFWPATLLAVLAGGAAVLLMP